MFGKTNDKIDSEIFAIYDTKVQSYGAPLFATNRHDVVRQLTNMFREPEQQQKNQLFLNAEDFSIFKIGTYEKTKGLIVGQNPPEHVANLHELKALIQKDSMSQTKQALYST